MNQQRKRKNHSLNKDFEIKLFFEINKKFLFDFRIKTELFFFLKKKKKKKYKKKKKKKCIKKEKTLKK